MKALWGSLSICPMVTGIRLPLHTAEELDSISHLKVWGNAQMPQHDMAYLLVWVYNTPNTRTYGLALVWVSPLQARASLMVEGLETLATLTFEGPDWLYTLIQLYEGANHMPLLVNKHRSVLSQEKMESLSGQISQLKIHQLLSTGSLVALPVELNGGDQAVTIDLLEPLCASSSVTANEHPYIEVNIPSPTTEEQGSTTPPQGRQHDTLPASIPKTPWKPRVALITEVVELLDRGMTDNYDQELEHSFVVDQATQVEASLSPKMEDLLLPLETSSQTSVGGMEASIESNPADAALVTAAHSSQSNSPIEELQLEVHLALNSIFTTKRTSELERQSTIRDFETWLHQQEAEAMATNEKAKVAHSWRDLQARIKCTKAIMRAKLEYQMTIQEARMARCTELQESEVAYSEALSETAAKKSRECTTLCQMHAEHMRDLEAQAIRAENRSHQDFLLMHQMLLHQAPHSVKEDSYSSYSLLLGPSSPSLQHTPFTLAPQAKVNPPSATSTAIPIKPEPRQSPPPKRQHFLEDAHEDMFGDEDFPPASQNELPSSMRGKMVNWQASMKSSNSDAFSQDSSLIKEARACYFATHPWDWTQGNMNDLSDIFRGLAQSAGLLGECIFEIQNLWKGPDHLKCANYILLDLPKGLKFLRAVSAKESLKVMGLKGIHNSEALWHFASYMYCLWCRKDRQNEGTVINHLRTIHYKLGLVCDLCFGCPMTMADTLH